MADNAADLRWDGWADDQEAHAPSETIPDGDEPHEVTLTRLSRVWEASCSCGCLEERPVPVRNEDPDDCLTEAVSIIRAGIDGPTDSDLTGPAAGWSRTA